MEALSTPSTTLVQGVTVPAILFNYSDLAYMPSPQEPHLPHKQVRYGYALLLSSPHNLFPYFKAPPSLIAASRGKLAPTETQFRYDTFLRFKEIVFNGNTRMYHISIPTSIWIPYVVELGFVNSCLPLEFGVNGWRGLMLISQYGSGFPLHSLLFFSSCMSSLRISCSFIFYFLSRQSTLPDGVHYTSRHEGCLDAY